MPELNPFNVILPVALAQFVGFDELLPVIAGVGFTTTVVVPAEDGQLMLLAAYAAVAITLYTPAIAVVALALTCGFCVVLVYPIGPLHSHVTGIVLEVVAPKFKGVPEHTGLFDVATGVAGV